MSPLWWIGCRSVRRGQRDDLPGGAEHRGVDELAALEHGRLRRLEPLDRRARRATSSLGRQVGLLDHRSCSGWIAARPRWPSSRPRRARAGEALVVAHVRVDGLRRPRQAGRDGGVDDPAARPVEPGLERARLGAEVGLAERDAGDARAGDRVRGLDAGGRLDQAVDGQRRSPARPRAGRPSARRRRRARASRPPRGRPRRAR